VNSGANPQAMYDDARATQKKESGAWPYAWVNGVDYPHREARSAIRGRLALRDSLAPTPMSTFSRLMVGLTAPAYVSPRGPSANGAPPPNVDWQTDAKHYEFWTRGKANGTF